MDTTADGAGQPVTTGDRPQPPADPAVEPAARSVDSFDIVIPVYNEPENFPNVLAEVERSAPGPFRVLMVYDFDGDTTLPVARELARDRPFLTLVRNEIGPGVINALKTAVQVCRTGPVAVVMADLSDDLAILPRMLELYRAGYDVVCPSRYMPGGRQIGGPRFKKFLSWLAGCSAYWLRGVPTHDITNNFRLYSGEMLKGMTIESTGGFEFALEVTAKAFLSGRSITEVPCCWRDRTAGQSRFRLFRWLPRYLRWYWTLLTHPRRAPLPVAR